MGSGASTPQNAYKKKLARAGSGSLARTNSGSFRFVAGASLAQTWPSQDLKAFSDFDEVVVLTLIFSLQFYCFAFLFICFKCMRRCLVHAQLHLAVCLHSHANQTLSSTNTCAINHKIWIGACWKIDYIGHRKWCGCWSTCEEIRVNFRCSA